MVHFPLPCLLPRGYPFLFDNVQDSPSFVALVGNSKASHMTGMLQNQSQMFPKTPTPKPEVDHFTEGGYIFFMGMTSPLFCILICLSAVPYFSASLLLHCSTSLLFAFLLFFLSFPCFSASLLLHCSDSCVFSAFSFGFSSPSKINPKMHNIDTP